MNALVAYRWSDVPKLAALALVYALIAVSVLSFFSANKVVSIFWPPSGIALAALILGGWRYWPGVFVGAFAGNLLSGSSIEISAVIAVGNMLEALTGSWMLKRFSSFDSALIDAKNYFSLAFAAVLCACVSALNGVSMLYWVGLLSEELVPSNLFKWWQGDVLGMILVTPLLLIWRQLPKDWFSDARSVETLAFLGLAFIFGQMVFLGWFHEFIGTIARGYWMFLFVVWGAVRYGRHGALLIIAMTVIQSLIGAALRIGYFGEDFSTTKLNNLWCYMLVFTMVGITLCLTMYERLKAEANVLRLTNLYKALSETNQAIVRMEQEAELFPLVCRCAVDYGHMDMAWIGQLDEANGLIIPVAKAGDGLGYLDGLVLSASADVPEGLGPTGTALRENHPIIINDFLNCEMTRLWHSRIVEYGWNSVATFPIGRNGKPFAVLIVYHKQLNAFDDEAVALLNEMASDISFALDNFDREQQRRIATLALEASERHFATLLSVTPVGVFETDQNGKCIYVNQRWLSITGLTWATAIGDGWITTLHTDDREEVIKQWLASSRQQQIFNMEYRFLRPNGATVWVLGQAEAFHSESGQLLGYTGTITDITEKKRSEELIWRQANFDNLTGLPNRSMFLDRLEQQIKKSRRSGLAMALLFLDLDYFKDINDTLGHSMGDLLLKEVALRLDSCVRDTDTVARLGGDEFTIIMTELHDLMIVERVAKAILLKMDEPIPLGSNLVYVSVSIGITLYPLDATVADALLKNADQAMYAAKLAGRNCFHYFTPIMQEAAQDRMRIANDLRHALPNQQFRVYYQPIINLATGCIHKAEALIRWQHPERGLISPAEFIPIAEETGMIHEIGNWVFCQAAQQAKDWQRSYDVDFQISVNKSPMQFRPTGKILNQAHWLVKFQELELSGQSIVVEITEGLLMDASENVIQKFDKFRDAGVQVALDDFGTGYSSLSYLKKFDIDYLKIDQSFVRNLMPDSDDLALCIAIIGMAHQLKIKVIAEGVETLQQRDLLAAAGCDYGQGYLWSKPVPADEFAILLQKQPKLEAQFVS